MLQPTSRIRPQRNSRAHLAQVCRPFVNVHVGTDPLQGDGRCQAANSTSDDDGVHEGWEIVKVADTAANGLAPSSLSTWLAIA